MADLKETLDQLADGKLVEAAVVEGCRLIQQELLAKKERLIRDLAQELIDADKDDDGIVFSLNCAIAIQSTPDLEIVSVFAKVAGKTSWKSRTANRLLDPAQGKFEFIDPDKASGDTGGD